MLRYEDLPKRSHALNSREPVFEPGMRCGKECCPLNLRYPDYDHCLANVPNSILKKWDLPQHAASMPLIDSFLEKDRDTVILLLLDGLGTAVMEEHLDRDGYFFRHLADECTSVFPPTTVAATTSAQCGKYPAGHAWLGWDNYYRQIGENVVVFRSTLQGTRTPAADYDIARRCTPYESVTERIRGSGGAAFDVTPFAAPFPETFPALCERIREVAAMPGKKYVYAYWPLPDSILHKYGRGSEEAYANIRELEGQVQALAESLENAQLIVSADHGHVNSECLRIEDYPDLEDCLVRAPSVEPRALNCFVKPGREAEFDRLFAQYFGGRFLLLTREEVLERQLFGPGEEHPEFRHMLGERLAVAVSDLSVLMRVPREVNYIGMHAGLTVDEMLIPLILIDRE